MVKNEKLSYLKVENSELGLALSSKKFVVD